MFVHEEKLHNSHQWKAFKKSQESHYTGFGCKQTAQHPLQRLPESHESFRDASESESFEGNSRATLHGDGTIEEAYAVQQRLSVFTFAVLCRFEVNEERKREKSKRFLYQGIFIWKKNFFSLQLFHSSFLGYLWLLQNTISVL